MTVARPHDPAGGRRGAVVLMLGNAGPSRQTETSDAGYVDAHHVQEPLASAHGDPAAVVSDRVEVAAMSERPFDYDLEEDPRMGLHWHLDKRVPIALILTILTQTIGVVWWSATINERVATLERRVDASSPQADRLTRVEVKIDNIADSISELKMTIRSKTDAH